MAKPWKEVAESGKFKELPYIEKQEAQQAYFNEVVAPKLSPEEINEARSEFLSKYTYSPEALHQATESLNISDALGIQPDQIDTKSGGDFWDRVDYSASDTDEEVVNKFATKYPDGTMFRVEIPREGVISRLVQPDSRLIFKYNTNDEKEKWKTVEDIGVSFGDLGDLAAPTAKAGATIVGGMLTGGSSIFSQMLAYGGSAALSHLGKEGIEELRGTQLQPAGEVISQAGIEGGITAGLTGVGGLVTKGVNIATGRGAFEQHPEIAALLREVKKGQKAGLGVDDLMAHQKAPENMIVSRLGAQAESTSKSAQHTLLSQKASAFNALKEGQASGYQGSKKVLTEVQRVYKKAVNDLQNRLGRLTPRRGDRAIAEGVEDFVNGSKARVTLKYNLADDAATKESPVFDISSAQHKAKNIKNLILGEARQTESVTITESGLPGVPKDPAPVNVAATPEGRLVGIIDDINKLKPTQINYQTVKQLRTRTGELIENWPWEANINKGQAKALYSTLTKILNNPSNKAPKFVKAHSEASAEAKARFDFLDAMSVQRLIKMEPSGSLIKELSKPNAMTDVHMKLFNDKSFPKEKLALIKKGIKNQIIFDEQGAMNSINKYQANDPEAWRFLVPKKEEKFIRSLANDLDKLNSSNIGQVVQNNVKASETLNNLILKEGTTRSEILSISKDIGVTGRGHLKAAIYEDIINRSETVIKGVTTIDKNALGSVIKEYQKKGVWDSPLLTKNDRMKIKGLKSYLDLIFFRGKDPGVSLEAAQAITSLKHPATFISGVHKLAVNSVMAKFLSSKMGDKLLIGSGRDLFKADPLIRANIIVNGLLEGTEPGDESQGAIKR